MRSPILAWGCSFSHSKRPLYSKGHFSYHSGDLNAPWSIIQLKVHQDGILMLNYDILALKSGLKCQNIKILRCGDDMAWVPVNHATLFPCYNLNFGFKLKSGEWCVYVGDVNHTHTKIKLAHEEEEWVDPFSMKFNIKTLVYFLCDNECITIR